MSNHKQRRETVGKPPALTGPEVAHFSMSSVARFSMSLDNNKAPPCRRGEERNAQCQNSTDCAHNVRRLAGLNALSQLATVTEGRSDTEEREWGGNWYRRTLVIGIDR